MLLFLKRIFNNIGYIYLLYYPKERLVKVGRSIEPITRFITIYNDLPNFIIPLGIFPVFDYKTLENTIKNDTRHLAKIPRGAGPGAGASEFRKLNILQICFLWAFLLIQSLFYLFFEIVCLGLLYCLINQNSQFIINLKKSLTWALQLLT